MTALKIMFFISLCLVSQTSMAELSIQFDSLDSKNIEDKQKLIEMASPVTSEGRCLLGISDAFLERKKTKLDLALFMRSFSDSGYNVYVEGFFLQPLSPFGEELTEKQTKAFEEKEFVQTNRLSQEGIQAQCKSTALELIKRSVEFKGNLKKEEIENAKMRKKFNAAVTPSVRRSN